MAHSYGLLCLNNELLCGTVPYCFGPLGFPGIIDEPRSKLLVMGLITYGLYRVLIRELLQAIGFVQGVLTMASMSYAWFRSVEAFQISGEEDVSVKE